MSQEQGPVSRGEENHPAVTNTRGTREVPQFIVGIGASAGGLDPLVRFFDNLPETTGMAFVIVQHLPPDFRSFMDELLGRHTLLPIHLVEDGMPVEADHVYLIPARTEMIISGGRLLLSERDRQQELTLPIDSFFRSLAQDCGAKAAAVVLSGGGSDGSRGICHVRDAGGLVLAQDLESAQFDGMPRAAIETGSELRRRVVDLRLIAGEAADAVRSQMEDKGLTFTVDLAADPLWVYGDAARLQQVQINLLSNAVKYTESGGHVSLHVRPEANGAVIRVKDNGRAFHARCSTRCSICSCKPDTRSIIREAVWASASRWCARSSRCTGAPCQHTVKATVPAASSPCGCP